MKSDNLYKLLVKSQLATKGFYIDNVEKFQRNEMFTENDFLKFTKFEYEDYILETGHKLKIKQTWDLKDKITPIVEVPVFIHLRPFRLFIFKINFVFTNYFEKIITDLDSEE